MARGEEKNLTSPEYSPRRQLLLPTIDHHLSPSNSKGSSESSHLPEEGQNNRRRTKKKLFAKVKEKAKKWRQVLVKKRTQSPPRRQEATTSHGISGAGEEREQLVHGNHVASPSSVEIKDIDVSSEPKVEVQTSKSIATSEGGDESFRSAAEEAAVPAEQASGERVSVKEYVMKKLEPREEDRALCEVITEVVNNKTMSSTKN